MLKPIFEIDRDARAFDRCPTCGAQREAQLPRAIPRLPFDGAGDPRVIDGVKFFDVAGAAGVTGEPEASLHSLWVSTFGDIVSIDDGSPAPPPSKGNPMPSYQPQPDAPEPVFVDLNGKWISGRLIPAVGLKPGYWIVQLHAETSADGTPLAVEGELIVTRWEGRTDPSGLRVLPFLRLHEEAIDPSWAE